MSLKKAGIFYGIGVGPGDPELMTMKAAKVLTNAKVIAVPRSADSSSEGSVALSIVRKAVDINGKELLELLFPMTKDKDRLAESRKEAAGLISDRLKKGEDVAFITLGDPMLYSTFSYLIPLVKELSGADVKSIPGVTSFSAAASIAALPLAESKEKVIIIPAAYDIEEIRGLIGSFDTMVLMKVHKIMDRLIDLLIELGIADKAFFVSRAGWPGEEIVSDIRTIKGRKLDYFSTVIVKR